ncbi:MAG: hypothetical protein L6V91_00950 [Bacilli bacterium]|nr:MAG: hypothetical protein L6V91_00950 [Bacilli bacterium]
MASKMYNTMTINRPLLLFMTASATARTISRHYNAPPLNYIQAPSMIINRINSTNTIAALEPVPHPQLPIIHSSFFSIHNIFMGK